MPGTQGARHRRCLAPILNGAARSLSGLATRLPREGIAAVRQMSSHRAGAQRRREPARRQPGARGIDVYEPRSRHSAVIVTVPACVLSALAAYTFAAGADWAAAVSTVLAIALWTRVRRRDTHAVSRGRL